MQLPAQHTSGGQHPGQAPASWAGQARRSAALCSGLTCRARAGQARRSAAMCSGLTCRARAGQARRSAAMCSGLTRRSPGWTGSAHLLSLRPRLGSAPQTAGPPSGRLAAGRDRLRHRASGCLLSWDDSPPEGLLVAEARRDALQHRCYGVCPAGGRRIASSAARLQAEAGCWQRDLA